MHERTALLAALGAALGQPSGSEPAPGLQSWHAAARKAFVTSLKESTAPEEIGRSNVQLSYTITRTDDQNLDPAELPDLARQMNFEIRDRVNTGWSMFYPFQRPPIAAFLNVDPDSGLRDTEFLESNLLKDEGEITLDADLWRLSPDAKATIIRPYRLDFQDPKQDGWQLGAWFSPAALARELGELTRHAQAFCERFEAPTEVEFLGEWRGLKGRLLADPGRHWSGRRVAQSDIRTVSRTWPVTALTESWPEIVAELAAPVLRAFDPQLRLGADWVRHEAQSWRPIGSHYP